MTDIVYYEEFEGFELAEIDGVSVEQFVAVIESLKECLPSISIPITAEINCIWLFTLK